LERSQTEAEKIAWQKVISWFDDILSRKRFLTKNDAIGIPFTNPKK